MAKVGNLTTGGKLDGSLELGQRVDGANSLQSCESLFKGKKSVIFTVPGAFTPTCSEKHLPGFVKLHDELKAAGAEVIACISVNDPFVMNAWGKDQEVGDKVLMLADGNGKWSEAAGTLVDKGAHMGMRCNRFAMILDKEMTIEWIAEGFPQSSAEEALAFLKK